MQGIEVSPEKNINDIKNQPPSYSLKVRGGDNPTDPVGLSRSILHTLQENPDAFCKVLSVGPVSLSVAMTAFRLASSVYSSKTRGSVLVLNQSEYSCKLDNDSITKGICTRIFPIPVSFQL